MSYLFKKNEYIDYWICNGSNSNYVKKYFFTKEINNNIFNLSNICAWNFWYNTNFAYKNSLQCISYDYPISTLKRLKYQLHQMVPIEQLPHGSNLYFFKSHITPQWEDRWNKNGARYIIPIYKTFFSNRPKYETWYDLLYIILDSPSENFIFMINGISFSRRKDNKDIVSIWINPYYYCDDDNNITEKEFIPCIISEILCINPLLLKYKKHPPISYNNNII